MKVLIIGASGKLGKKAAEYLLDFLPAKQIVLTSRTPEKLTTFQEQGVAVKYADYNDKKSLDEALIGIDRVLLISSSGDSGNRVEQHSNAVYAAKEANVKLIVYTSAPQVEKGLIRLFDDHLETEKIIKSSGIPYVFLRNNWYLENEQENFENLLKNRTWNDASEGGKAGWALRREYALAAAKTLVFETKTHIIYELSGKPTTTKALVAAFNEATGLNRDATYLTTKQFADSLKTLQFPDHVIDFIVNIQTGIKKGALEVNSNALETIIGKPLTPLTDAILEVLQAHR